jgi:two-component system sensor histidine kinase GlrK
MLLGLALVAVPLLVALVDAGLQIRVLADLGQKLVAEGVSAARDSQEMVSQIAELERTARQYFVLNDKTMLDIYRTKDEALSATREKLGRQVRTPAAQAFLEELRTQQGTIRLSVLSMSR